MKHHQENLRFVRDWIVMSHDCCAHPLLTGQVSADDTDTGCGPCPVYACVCLRGQIEHQSAIETRNLETP